MNDIAVMVNNSSGEILIDMRSLAFNERTIYITGYIDEDVYERVLMQLRYLMNEGNREIRIVLKSNGGEVASGLGIIDAIELVKKKGINVRIDAYGVCASMASIILSAGSTNHRYVAAHCEVMIHQPLGGGEGKASDIEIMYKHIYKTRDTLAQIISTNTKKSAEEVLNDMATDYWMSANEAIEYGLADHILVS